VNWSIVTGDESWADLDMLPRNERADLAEALTGWVVTGPPRRNRREPAGVENVFEDEVLARVFVTYFVDEVSGIVGVLRVRKR
jgi:hypothetical protein